jgi:hypothetical protein
LIEALQLAVSEDRDPLMDVGAHDHEVDGERAVEGRLAVRIIAHRHLKTLHFVCLCHLAAAHILDLPHGLELNLLRPVNRKRNLGHHRCWQQHSELLRHCDLQIEQGRVILLNGLCSFY